MRYSKIVGLVALGCLAIGLLLLLSGEMESEVTNRLVVKINGITFEAPHSEIEKDKIEPIKKMNANWVALTPFAFSRANEPGLVFNRSRQWWGERIEGIAKTVEYARDLELKVMIKPHVWVRGQGWPGEFELDSEGDWKLWEAGYRDYILSYAKVADSLDADMFCVGTEFRKAAVQRPEFWKDLIAEVKTLYSGKLTYASNWDNYENISFWEELDYIGIDAYFPISDKRTPEVDHLVEGWSNIGNKLEKFSRQNNIPILFTEFGYRSMDHAAGGDWNYDVDAMAVNEQAQSNAYQALFNALWSESWFAGGFIWKWHAFNERRMEEPNKRFSPQGKLAEETIREWYGEKR